MSPDQLSFTVIQVVSSIVAEENLQLNWREQGAIAKEILDDIIGNGPIEDLLSDAEITDILVNGPNTVFVERKGRLERTALKFRDEQHLFEVARRIANSVGRRLDEASPMVDARLSDGSRVNVIAPPLSVNGTIISIRKFSPDVMALSDLLARHTLSEEICRFLEIAMQCRLNILVSGGTGSGKTTLLNAISGLIEETERVVTIEDAVEIRLQSPHVVSLETRQQNSEGTGEVTQRDLLRNCLRMRPDRIIVGEVRGSEAYDMLQAMNTGHDGSMSTIHANSCRDALIRLENLVLVSQPNLQASNARQQIASAVDLVIHLQRTPQGNRVIGAISEVVGTEGDTITLQDIFQYVPKNNTESARSDGSSFRNSGLRPRFLDKVDISDPDSDPPFHTKDQS
ncbi:MAG: CpaF family protein [Proteobacteria bacterium]|nr:CpaF family protein [Pseudomonadota bacterium]